MYAEGDEDNEFIPIPAGVYSTLMRDRVLSTLGGKYYTVRGNRIVVHADLIGEGVAGVDVQLCVADISALGPNDILPVSADMQGKLVEYALQLLLNKTETDA